MRHTPGIREQNLSESKILEGGGGGGCTGQAKGGAF